MTYTIIGSTTGGLDRQQTRTNLKAALALASDFRGAYEPTSGSSVSIQSGDETLMCWRGGDNRWYRAQV